MAWRCGGSNHQELIGKLKSSGIIKSPQVESSMLAVDRANYCKTSPYLDSPQSIGFAATISAPHMHAYVLEFLKDHLHEGATALGKISLHVIL